MKKIERKYFEEGDTVSLNHSFDLTYFRNVEMPISVNKNCFIYSCTKDYYYLCQIKSAKTVHFIKTRKNLKNNVFSSKNLLIEKRIFSFLPRYNIY
jgi:hypothetical protein